MCNGRGGGAFFIGPSYLRGPSGHRSRTNVLLCHINDLPSSVASSVRMLTENCDLYCPIIFFQNHIDLQKDLKALVTYMGIRLEDDIECLYMKHFKGHQSAPTKYIHIPAE